MYTKSKNSIIENLCLMLMLNAMGTKHIMYNFSTIYSRYVNYSNKNIIKIFVFNYLLFLFLIIFVYLRIKINNE